MIFNCSPHELNGDGGSNATSKTITLQASQWQKTANGILMHGLDCEGVTRRSTVICGVKSVYAMEHEAARCMVRCATQSDGHLLFRSLNGEAPAIDIDVNILAFGFGGLIINCIPLLVKQGTPDEPAEPDTPTASNLAFLGDCELGEMILGKEV